MQKKLKTSLVCLVKNDVLNEMYSYKQISDKYADSFGLSEYKKYGILVGKLIVEESMLFLNEKKWI